MHVAPVTTDGEHQFVRLPAECRFDAGEVFALRIGEMVILYPPVRGWDVFERGLGLFTTDFMADRNQPPGSEARNDLEP